MVFGAPCLKTIRTVPVFGAPCLKTIRTIPAFLRLVHLWMQTSIHLSTRHVLANWKKVHKTWLCGARLQAWRSHMRGTGDWAGMWGNEGRGQLLRFILQDSFRQKVRFVFFFGLKAGYGGKKFHLSFKTHWTKSFHFKAYCFPIHTLSKSAQSEKCFMFIHILQNI